MSNLFLDSIGFAGAKMIRRIVGIAHVADLETIEDPSVRSQCEKKSLTLGKRLVVASNSSGSSMYSNIEEVAAAAKQIYVSPAPASWD
jgi:5-methylthioribose kinase